jgi:hypothetical protein
MRIRDEKSSDPESEIRDGKNSDPGSRINIRDPQHWSSVKMRQAKLPRIGNERAKGAPAELNTNRRRTRGEMCSSVGDRRRSTTRFRHRLVRYL